MSSELARLHQSSRKTNLFWFIVTLGLTIYCLSGVFLEQPDMLHTWRGGALLLLSSAFLFRYAFSYWKRYYTRQGRSETWPIPWRPALRNWSLNFVLVCLMTTLHPLMGWLFWTTFGMAFGLFCPPWMLVPATLSALGIFYTLLVTSNPPLQALPWIIISMGLSILCSGYLAYLPGRLMRERIEREQVFSRLEEAHRQLAEAHRQLALSAEREAELAVYQERARLAREMHDTIGHALVLMTVKLEAAQRLRAVNPERADHEIEATKEIARSTMSEMRATLANLRASAVEHEPVGEALARRAREAGEHAGFHVTYQIDPDLGELRLPLREALYRVGTEALTNIEKHARAHEVSIHLARQGDAICLRIEDDGVGLPVPSAAGKRANGAPAFQPSSPPSHYGITGMRERVEALGGQFTLTSRPGKGTIVEVSIPLSSEQP